MRNLLQCNLHYKLIYQLLKFTAYTSKQKVTSASGEFTSPEADVILFTLLPPGPYRKNSVRVSSKENNPNLFLHGFALTSILSMATTSIGRNIRLLPLCCILHR
jgi:hypothetical protein